MDIRQQIFKEIRNKGQLKVTDIVEDTGFSRVYINRIFRELRNEGKIVLIGKANRAVYVPANKEAVLKAKAKILRVRKTLNNVNLSEDVILDEIKREGGVFIGLKKNIEQMLNYAFTEILNNAIEHSQSDAIFAEIRRTNTDVIFEVVDKGIGIFNNIMHKKHLNNALEAIQDLLKGKQTTAPLQHSGEGIFFTSKLADTFVIQSSNKKLIFNNLIEDIFIQDVKNLKGTRVSFTVAINAKKRIEAVFKDYTGDSYEFSKTEVAVRLYNMGSLYVSRSQARRIISGLDKFTVIVLDFHRIKTIGQSFADEIFRVWHNRNPGINIIPKNANENINFMIGRAIGAADKDR